MIAFIVPLFTFLGVREGIVGSLTQKFLDNPRNLEIGPAMGVWRFNRAFFAEFLAHPDVTFVVPETASISASVLLSKKGFSDVNAVIVATGEGDPILPRDASGNPPHNLGFTDVFVTQELADSLNLSVGDQVMGRKTRDKGGVEETLRLEFTVRGVVSIDYVAGSVIFTSLELMEEIDGFRAPMNLPTVAPPRDPDGLLDDSPAPVAANDPLMDESLLPTAEEELSTEETIFPTAEDSPLTEEIILPTAEASPSIEETILPIAEDSPLTEEIILPTVEASPSIEEAILPIAEDSPLTEEAILPTAEDSPLTEEIILPTAEASPSIEEAILPIAEDSPLTEEIILPTAEDSPLTEDIILPTAETSPSIEEAILPTAEASPSIEEAILPTAEGNPLTQEIILPTAEDSPLTEETILPTAEANPLTEDPVLLAAESNAPSAESVLPTDGASSLSEENIPPNVEISPLTGEARSLAAEAGGEAEPASGLASETPPNPSAPDESGNVAGVSSGGESLAAPVSPDGDLESVGASVSPTAPSPAASPDGALESASVPGAAPTAPSPASLEPTPAPGLEPPPDTPAAPSLALPEAPDSSAVAGYREIYPRFRMYARNIDAVESLRLNLLEKGYRVSTKAGEIAVVRLLDKGFFVLFWVIFGVAVVGAFLSVVSGSADQVEKSRKSLAYLALLGFGRGRLLLFNSVQTFLTGVLAAAGSIGLFYFASHLLNKYFRGAINDVDKICYLSWEELLVCGGAVVVLMLVASFAALPLLSKIEPSEGMRDV